jgi:branched-chain amino acid transport system substrate-binding protein
VTRTTRRRFAGAAASALVAGAAAPAPAQIFQLPPPLGSQVTGPALNFAVAVPLSGEQRAFGEQVVDGARQAVYDANQTKAPNDPLFNVRTYDDQGSLAGAGSQAQFIINDPTLVAVIGHLGSRITDIVVPRYGGALVPQIVPASTYDPITAHGYRTVFRLPTKDSSEGSLFAQYLDLHSRPNKIVVFASDGDYGPDVAQAFVQQATADKVPVTRINVSTAKPDYRDATTRALAEQPDFLFFAGLVKDLGGVLDLMRVSGYTGAMGASQGFFDGTTISRYGKGVEGLIVSTSSPPLNLAPAAFVPRSNFEQQYGVSMTPLAAFGYAAAQIIITLVRRTGANNRLTFARALNAPLPLDTVVGSFSFGVTGDPLNPQLYFYTVKAAKWEYAYAVHPTAFLLR